MSLLVLESYRMLAWIDLYLLRGDFHILYKRVRSFPAAPKREKTYSVENICAAVDMASIWYWKRVLCLQRSAAAACLLKRYGIHATMVIGAQMLPFKAHAWVEVDGRVVNDKSYVDEMYVVLDRCS